MVFFNYSTMQMAAKVVYYGPGLCGKTTNLQFIYGHTSGESRGEMVSLETESDRTLFFDLLPIDVGSIQGFNTRIQLYTVPGQVFYNTTRKLVLKGVDGVVFVADSQRPMLRANLESLRNLEENLAEMHLSLATVPIVLQYNKRDLPDVVPVEELQRTLNPQGWEYHEASAVTGMGVFETLRGISRLTLIHLKNRLAKSPAEEPRPRAAVVVPARPIVEPAPVAPPPVVAPPAPVAVPPAAAPPPVEAPLPPTPAARPSPPAAGAAPKAKNQLDVLAELERIRRQTLRTPRVTAPMAPPPPPTAAVTAPRPAPVGNGRSEIHRTLDLALRRADFSRARRFTFTLRVEDGEHQSVETIKDFPVEIKDAATLEKILLHLNISVHAKE